jgi:uncharacterized membrane protein YkvA (DUF1232 family)
MEQLVKNIEDIASKAGMTAIYSALLLFYSFKGKKSPNWAKRVIIGTLSYLVSPIDFVPDMTPIIGYTDDIGILSYALVSIACYIDMDVRINARKKTKVIFGKLIPSVIVAVDNKI